MANLTLFFEYLEQVHLYKDVGMIPIYLKKFYNINSSIVFYSNTQNINLPNTFRGINLIKLEKSLLNKIPLLNKIFNPFTIYLIKNARQIDLLMLIHLKRKNFFYSFLYKFLNPNGKTYLKLDINLLQLNDLEKEQKKKIQYLKNELSKFDIISAETKTAYQKIKNLFNLNNILLLPNGFDNLSGEIPKILPYNRKQNIIITVGRIGAKEKNNQLLLNALERIDLKNWKVYFIGPIENEFLSIISNFYKNNPHLKESVFFTGNIDNRKELYNWYNKSKVFCSTSLWEGFSISMVEALYFCNYIISTKTGAAEDIIENNTFGKIYEINDINSLAKELQDVIDGNINLKIYYKKISVKKKYFSWENIIKNFYDNTLNLYFK